MRVELLAPVGLHMVNLPLRPWDGLKMVVKMDLTLVSSAEPSC